MNLSKRLLVCVLALVMVGAIFAGCTKEAAPEETSAPEVSEEVKEEATEEAKEEVVEEPVEEEVIDRISFMGVNWGGGPIQDSEMELFWEEYFGVLFDVDWVSYQDYNTKLNTLLAADNIPDVVQLRPQDGSYYFPALTQAIDAGIIADLAPYLFDGGFVEGNEILSTWSDTIWGNCVYNGGTYILPGATTEVAVGAVNIRRDLMTEYGFTEEPTTVDELKDFLLGLSEASGLYALDFSTPNFMDLKVFPIAVAYTGMMEWGIDDAGEFVYQPFADGYSDFLDFMKDLYDAGAIDPEFILNQGDNSKWQSGKSVACIRQWYNWNQSADLVSNKIFDKSLPDTYEAWCLLPVEGPKGYLTNVEAYGFSPARAISAKCSDAKINKILEVICATGEEYMNYLKFGVEDIHFRWEDDVRVRDDSHSTARTEGYVGGWTQVLLAQNADKVTEKFIERTSPSSDEAIARAWELKDATEAAAAEMDLGLATLNLQSPTYTSDWGILTADVNDMCAKYVMGQITLDDWNAYVDSIVSTNAYQTIIAEFKAAAGN